MRPGLISALVTSLLLLVLAVVAWTPVGLYPVQMAGIAGLVGIAGWAAGQVERRLRVVPQDDTPTFSRLLGALAWMGLLGRVLWDVWGSWWFIIPPLLLGAVVLELAVLTHLFRRDDLLPRVRWTWAAVFAASVGLSIVGGEPLVVLAGPVAYLLLGRAWSRVVAGSPA